MKARITCSTSSYGFSPDAKSSVPDKKYPPRKFIFTMIRGKWLATFSAVALLIASVSPARADQNVSLGWNPSTNAVVGYAIHYGGASHNYPFRLDVGTNTSVSFSNLQPGQTNFFAVTAYDSTGAESVYSSELAYIVPGVIRCHPPVKTGDVTTLQFPVAPGHWYEVQATTDFQTWSTISTTSTMMSNCWTSVQDPKSKAFHSRFYRLVLH